MPATELTLAQANAIIEGALSEGARLKLKPLTVAVLDAGGHLIALQRQDTASNLRPQIATAKAAGALALGVSSRQIGVMAQERPHFVNALAYVKKAAAQANGELKCLDAKIADAIVKACDEILEGKLHDQFPVDMFQGGAGTSTNMISSLMLKKLRVCVFPGFEDVRASAFRWQILLMNDDFPTFDRPASATSGNSWTG